MHSSVLPTARCCLGLTPGTPLLLDSLEGHALRIALLAQHGDLVFDLESLLLPSLAVGLDLVALRFEVAESFLQGRGELLLGVQVLLDRLDAAFLVLDDLRVDELLAGVPRARRRDVAAIGLRGNVGERREGNRRWWRGKGSCRRALAQVRVERTAAVVRAVLVCSAVLELQLGDKSVQLHQRADRWRLV